MPPDPSTKAAQPGFEFDAAIHEYTVDQMLVPHCTGILEVLDMIDYGGVPQYTLARKTLIGTVVHKATQYVDQDGLAPDLGLGLAMDDHTEQCEAYDIKIEDTEPYELAYLKFQTDTGFVPRLIEKRWVATVNGMRYGMTIDREGLVAGKPTILDLKCCHGKEKYWPVQLAGYALGLPKPDDVVRWERSVLWLKPDATYQILPGGRVKTDHVIERRDEETFLAALRIAHWKREELGHF